MAQQDGGAARVPVRGCAPARVHLSARLISLAQPRPGMQRAQNEYAEAPLRAAGAPLLSAGGAVTKQPLAFPPAGAPRGGECASRASSARSIVCRECGRCRCEACARPRRLPSRWLCGQTCLCGADALLDYASCACCVKALFYHCAGQAEADGASCADRPCSCAPHRRCARWAAMAALAPLLPCLLCYWPLRGCLSACQLCYQRYHRRGCTCAAPPPSSDKTLLCY